MLSDSQTRADRDAASHPSASVPAFAAGPAAEEEDHSKVGFARPRATIPGVSRSRQHAGRSRQARRPARLHRRRQARPQQVADVNSMIAQGVDSSSSPRARRSRSSPAVMAAKKAGIPGVADRPQRRSVDGKGGRGLPRHRRLELRPGRPAGRGLDDRAKTGGKGKIIELEGTSALPRQRPQEGLRRDDRGQGDGHAEVGSQSGDFARDKGGRSPRPSAGAPRRDGRLRAQRRDGARRDRRDRGRRQGPRQGHLVVSIDGEKDARPGDRRRQARLPRASATRASVPEAFDILYQYAAGETIPAVIINPDRFFDASNADGSAGRPRY